MSSRVDRFGLQVDSTLDAFITNEALPQTGVNPNEFWQGFADLVAELTPRNTELLRVRDELQEKIDAWHLERKGSLIGLEDYKAFLHEIGYLVEEGDDFQIATSNVDPEIAEIAGPQLVVPVLNARFALNAANARWGSAYDAFYGTDIIPEGPGTEKGSFLQPSAVVSWWSPVSPKNLMQSCRCPERATRTSLRIGQINQAMLRHLRLRLLTATCRWRQLNSS